MKAPSDGAAVAQPALPKPARADLPALRRDLLILVAERYPGADLDAVGRAFDMAVEAHSGQRRASGVPYVTHPIAAARIVADLGIDPVAVQAALLHDVPEDTEYSLSDIEERFGSEVAQLVDGVTKLGKFSTLSHEQQQAENIRKMFLAMADDIRVVLIKLADRLHNMRTLAALPPEKRSPESTSSACHISRFPRTHITYNRAGNSSPWKNADAYSTGDPQPPSVEMLAAYGKKRRHHRVLLGSAVAGSVPPVADNSRRAEFRGGHTAAAPLRRQ
jgi:hypothetical protein